MEASPQFTMLILVVLMVFVLKEMLELKEGCKKTQEHLEKNDRGTQMLLRKDLEQMFYKMRRDGFSVQEKEMWFEMYDAYHNLGSNGVMDTKKIWLEEHDSTL